MREKTSETLKGTAEETQKKSIDKNLPNPVGTAVENRKIVDALNLLATKGTLR